MRKFSVTCVDKKGSHEYKLTVYDIAVRYQLLAKLASVLSGMSRYTPFFVWTDTNIYVPLISKSYSKQKLACELDIDRNTAHKINPKFVESMEGK